VLGEQPSLGLEIPLHRLVEVEVILREVGERERPEANPLEPVELGPMRRRLHHAAAVAGVEHRAEGALEVDRLRRSAHRRPRLPTHA
jgi:hypothetical protein